jgi:hypothetical protein
MKVADVTNAIDELNVQRTALHDYAQLLIDEARDGPYEEGELFLDEAERCLDTSTRKSKYQQNMVARALADGRST